MSVLLADGQVTPGGPGVAFVLTAVALFAVAVYLFFRKTVRPQVSLALLVAALVLGVGSVGLMPKSPPARSLGVSIIRPRAGAIVAAGKPIDVEVALKGGRLTKSVTGTAPNAGHLHVLVDGAIVSMSASTVVPVTLSPGRHVIEVDFVAPNHLPFAPPVSDTIDVIAR